MLVPLWLLMYAPVLGAHEYVRCSNLSAGSLVGGNGRLVNVRDTHFERFRSSPMRSGEY